MKITIVIPTLNEEQSIGAVIDAIPIDAQVLVIDSSSTDRTAEIARSKGALVVNEPKLGYGRAYKTGFEHASGDIIVTLDGDQTYPADKIPELIETLDSENLDFITCDRLTTLNKEVMSLKHRLGNFILTWTANVLFGVKIKDSQSGMWVFRRAILENLNLISDGMAFSEELKIEAYKKGFRFKEVAIDYRVRAGEVKLSSWKDGIKNLLFLPKKRFASTKRAVAPT